ncbi:hypothetical protein SNE40_020679 [Patella caerulea]|uniref:JmjC domain-containing protein n=1 Tax=Patella caerulea TaxID=87958 RepID=A0AAN8PG42_PATCE
MDLSCCSRIFLNFFLVCILGCLDFVNTSEEIDLTKEPGHLQKFGTGRPGHQIEEVVGFPNPEDFFTNYYLPQKPVKLRTGAKLSPAFHLWTDEYFLNLDIPAKSKVHLETVKKESRQQRTLHMDFKKFVKNYMNTSYYMVDTVPAFLKPDLVLPCSLQCPDLLDNKFVEIMMWFSSGGTNSVVHFDAVDNINCVYRGSKDFVIVDPIKYEGMVPIDRPEGSYSDIDVDKMDYVKYPTLAKVEYIHAHLEPGDCLYIPYKWIHQVRSYNSNLAVNIWWNHYDALDVDTSKCNKECDKTMTLDQVKTTGFDYLLNSNENIKAHLSDGLANAPGKVMTFEKFIHFIFPMISDAEGDEFIKEEIDTMKENANKLLDIIDQDKDEKISIQDINKLSSAHMLEISGILNVMEAIQDSIDEKFSQDELEGGDGLQDDLGDEGQLIDVFEELKSDRDEL